MSDESSDVSTSDAGSNEFVETHGPEIDASQDHCHDHATDSVYDAWYNINVLREELQGIFWMCDSDHENKAAEWYDSECICK